VIDYSKLSGENFWDQWYKKPQATTPTTTANPVIKDNPYKQPTTAANPAESATTGATDMSQNYQPFTNYPSQWQTANDTLTGIATADPNSWGDWYTKAKAAAQPDITDAIRQAVESAGMGGMRWSESLGRTGQDIAGRTMGNLASQYAQNEMQGYQQNQQNRMGAAQGLMGLGQQYSQLPMDVANNMMGMGGQMQNAYNQQISPYYNLWNSMQSYNSPWLQNFMQMAQSSQPTTYNESGASQGMSAITSLLPLILGFL